MRVRLWRVLAGGAGVVLLAGGCAPSRPHNPDLSHLATDAIRALQRAGSAGATLSVEILNGDVGGGIRFSGSQQAQYVGAEHDADTTYTSRGIGMAAGTPINAELISLGTTVYRKGFSQRPDRPWQRYDAPTGTPSPGPSAPVGADPGLAVAALFDPVTYLTLAQEASGPHGMVTVAGGLRLGGTQTQGYQATCLFGAGPGYCRLHDLGAITAALPEAGHLTVRYWLDGLSQPRKISASGALGSGGGALNLDVTMTLDQFQAPATITAPPAAQTVACASARCG